MTGPNLTREQLIKLIECLCDGVASWNDCMDDGDRGRGNNPLILVLHEDASGLIASSIYPPFVNANNPHANYRELMNIQAEFSSAEELADYLISHYDALDTAN